ncbi:MAG: hypothetical protein K2N26_02790 [Oscillospiraceae bacterium]|nr:hypothetical protein [Oscillospiraceae bacterium]
MRKLKYTAAALMLCILMSGCSDDQNVEYHVYSNGVLLDSSTITPAEGSKNNSADFYIPEGMVTDYYKTYALTDEERRIYNETVKNLGRLKETVTLPVDSNIYSRILETIRLEQLSFNHISTWRLDYATDKQEFVVNFFYRLTTDEISSMNIAAERAAKEIIAQLTPEMDDYEKLKFFHDYLVLNCDSDTEDEYADTIYGALVRKKALCEGYTKAFSYLCNLVGIENVIVTGETYVRHMWNMVKLNGNWYHVDVTWDKPDDKLHEEYPDVILYQYFMVTDSVIKNNHTIVSYPAEPPKAYGTEENYFVREGADVTSEDGLLTAAENAIMGAVKSRKTSAMIKFSTTDLYLSSLAYLGDEELFTPVIERVKAECGENIELLWTDYYGQYRILTFIINYEN